jgi:isopenicillin N synthase-like dioxygenase
MERQASFTVPVIDLAGTFSAGERRSIVAAEVAAAGRTTGMFFITGHAVPDALIARHFAYARAFFALDLAEKRAIDVGRSNAFRGYEAIGTQTIDRDAPGDLKEGFIMGPDLAADHPHVVARYPNTGTNLWPRRPAGLREHMQTYVHAMNALGTHLAALLALSLDLPETSFAQMLAEPLTYTQLLHYPSVPPSAGRTAFGAGAHVDWGFLTILLQDDVGGFEVRAPDGRWQAVAPVPGSFAIILGELTVRLTNGRYRSAVHRVARNTAGRSRYAMPTFFDPGYDWPVAALASCGEPRYPERTVAEHMREMARATLTATSGEPVPA